jgi:hypothetical protein
MTKDIHESCFFIISLGLGQTKDYKIGISCFSAKPVFSIAGYSRLHRPVIILFGIHFSKLVGKLTLFSQLAY